MFNYSSVPAYSFGKSTKTEQNSKLPGPGAYDPNKADKITQKQEITSVKLKPGHFPEFSNGVKIGPGQYNIPDNNWSSPTAKFSHADRNKIYSKNVPGPGAYNSDNMEERLKADQKNIVFGKSERINANILKNNIPGPGQYEVNEVNQSADRFRAESGYKFDKSKRDGLYKNSMSPGPGTYDAKVNYIVESAPRGYSLGKHNGRANLANKNIPGPGAYDPLLCESHKNIKFPKKERLNMIIKKDNTLGPGQYNQDIAMNKLSAKPGIKFSKSEAVFKENKLPGPGNYDPKVSIFEKRAVPFLKEERIKQFRSDVPGPGQYENNLDQTSKVGRFKFDKQIRGQKYKSDVPGPGTYESKNNETALSYKLSKQERLVDKKSLVPGPGNYNPDPKYWDLHFPKFGKSEDRVKKGGVVGPGMYNIPHTIPDVASYNYPGLDKRKIKLWKWIFDKN